MKPKPDPQSSSTTTSTKTSNPNDSTIEIDSKLAKITSVKITLLARTLRQHLNAVWRHAEGILIQVVERMREGDMSDVGAEGVRKVRHCEERSDELAIRLCAPRTKSILN